MVVWSVEIVMGVTTSLAGVAKPAPSGATEVVSVSKVASGDATFGLALESAQRILEAAGTSAAGTTGAETKKKSSKVDAAKKAAKGAKGAKGGLGADGADAKPSIQFVDFLLP